ncbi:MAG: hypothetical protein [Caudoviricetes sp.]|nr:MAG: hypothetical protein [Caudoviricetes sp.]
MFIKVGRDFVDDCYKKGVVKPNEYRQIVDNFVDEELKLRKGLPIVKKVHFFWVKRELDASETEHFYFANSSKDVYSVTDAIIDIAYNSPEKLLLPQESIKAMVLANKFFVKSKVIRDCSDMLKNRYITEETLLVDKKTLWASDFLQKHRQAAYDLLALLVEDDTIILD